MTEPGWSAAASELAQLMRRARVYPWRVISVTLLLALSVVAIEALKEHAFRPRYVMRVLEADRDARTAPRMKRQLREYVMTAVFSNAALEPLLKKHGLYPALSRNNPQAALESFREDIEVEVYRNFFIEERSPHDAPRSARISVTYRSENSALSLAVTRDLGQLVVEHELQNRQRQADGAAARARLALDDMSERYVQRKRKMSQTSQLVANDDGARELATVELAGMASTLEELERDLEIAEQRSAALELGKDLEAHHLGLLFQTVDPGAIPRSAERESRDLLWLGVLTFFFGLPLGAMAVGAFSPAIVNLRDLRHSPLPVLGEVRGLRLSERSHAA